MGESKEQAWWKEAKPVGWRCVEFRSNCAVFVGADVMSGAVCQSSPESFLAVPALTYVNVIVFPA